MNDAAFWESLSLALIVIGLMLMGMGTFLFYRMRLHKYIAIRRRQKMMGMPPAKKERRKKRKKDAEGKPETKEEGTTDGGIKAREPEPHNEKSDEDGMDGTAILMEDENGEEGTTALPEEEKDGGCSEGCGMTEELEPDIHQGTTLLNKEQKEEAERLENGGAWVPPSRTFRIIKRVTITHATHAMEEAGNDG